MALRETYEKARQHKLLLWIAIVFAVALVLIALFSLYLVLIYPVNQVAQYGITNATEEANLINQYRTTSIQFISTLAQILGGCAVAVGIYFAWGNLITAKEGQITERFTRAVEQLGAIDQLGNPAIEIRLGGIYALERIANESDKDYWPIMEILTAYIRKNSPIVKKDVEVKNTKVQDQVALDIQAILTVIKRCNCLFSLEESNCLDLQRTSLDMAHLEGAHLERADFSRANLWVAFLRGAHLEGADFWDAHLECADLSNAHLEGANLGASLEAANLKGAHLERADFYGANLKWANLLESSLEEASFEEANLEGARLEGASLKGAKNLTVDQLSKVKTLYNAKLDEELEKALREKYPALFEKPNE